MKIVGVFGSPRRDSNSHLLGDRVLAGAAGQGAEVEKFELCGMELAGCRGCDACKTKSDRCVFDDDINKVLDAVRAADAVVFASPVYFGGVSGQFKLFFDRTYSFFGSDYSSRLKPGKKSVFVTVQTQPAEAMFADIVPHYERFLRLYGFASVVPLRGVGFRKPGAVLRDDALMQRAEDLGRKLAE